MATRSVTDQDFANEVLGASKPVLVQDDEDDFTDNE